MRGNTRDILEVLVNNMKKILILPSKRMNNYNKEYDFLYN